jgi:hypothetical protein
MVMRDRDTSFVAMPAISWVSTPYGAEPMRLYAAPMRPVRDNPNPFARFDFFDVDGTLSVADAQKRSP